MKGTKKMKNFKILVRALALTVVAATIIACNKEKETNASENLTGELKAFSVYYNGDLMESFSETDYIPTKGADMDLTSIVDTNSINYFDQDASFKQFCKTNQMDVIYENNLKLNLIHQKAVELGLVDGDNEAFPQDMADYWQSVYGTSIYSMMEPDRALLLKLYDGPDWDGQSMSCILPFRAKLGSMDNKVSSLTQYLGSGATVMCYDKWFGGTKRWYWCFIGTTTWTLSLPRLQQDDNKYSSYFTVLQ
jgi:hypothetical protein